MDYKKILRAVLSKQFKIDGAKLDELMAEKTTKDGKEADTTDDDLENKILDLDKTRVAELSTVPKGKTFQDGYAKAKAEERGAFEKEIKEKFGVDADVTGVDLISAIVEDKTKGGAKKEITDDDVKKHPVYQNLEKDMKAKVKQVETDFTEKLTAKDTEYNKGKTLTVAQQRAWDAVVGMKPVLSTNTKVADTHKATFLKSLGDYDFELQGDNIVVMKDGKVVDDGHGHSKDFTELVKDMAGNYFEFQNNNGGSNGGNNNDKHPPGGGGTGYPTSVTKPKTLEDYAKIVDDPKVPLADKQKVAEVWEQEHSNQM